MLQTGAITKTVSVHSQGYINDLAFPTMNRHDRPI